MSSHKARDLSRPLHLWTGIWKPTPGTVGWGAHAGLCANVLCELPAAPPNPQALGPRLPDLCFFLCPFPPRDSVQLPWHQLSGQALASGSCTLVVGWVRDLRDGSGRENSQFPRSRGAITFLRENRLHTAGQGECTRLRSQGLGRCQHHVLTEGHGRMAGPPARGSGGW